MSSADEYLRLSTSQLITRIVAKQLVYKGIAIGGVMALRAVYPTALEKFQKHVCLRPLLLYLKPAQVAVELGSIGLDYLTLHLASRLVGPVGAFPSPVHLLAFADGSLQCFLPHSWRWVFTFIPLTTDAIGTLTTKCGFRELMAYGAMTTFSKLVQTVLCEARRAWQKESSLKMRTRVIFLLEDMSSLCVSYLVSSAAVALAPRVTLATPKRWVLTSGAIEGVLDGTVTMCLSMASLFGPSRILVAAQGWTPPVPPVPPKEVLMSKYHDLEALTATECREFDHALMQVANDARYDNNIRMHAVRKLDRLSEYYGLYVTGQISHPLDKAKYQFSGASHVVTAHDIASGREQSVCVLCYVRSNDTPNVKSFDLGSTVHRFDCDHSVCLSCLESAEFDRCPICFMDCASLSDEERGRQLERAQSLVARMVDSWNRERLVPFWLQYGRWYEAAVFGVNSGLISRHGANRTMFALAPQDVGSIWLNAIAAVTFSVFGLYPVEVDFRSRVLFL